jgi:K+-sensing histidine kinase KdpD
LLGARSPLEAFDARRAVLRVSDLTSFCQSVADNAVHLGYENVHFTPPTTRVVAEFDAELLEDAVVAILDNAARERKPGTEIRLLLTADDEYAQLAIKNLGSSIQEEDLERVFDYNFSTREDSIGQGLFVAKTAVTKQGGRLTAHNLGGRVGVVFVIELRVS